jgi:Beta-lactamase
MNQRTLRQRFTTGLYWRLVMAGVSAVVVGLALSTQAAAARECARETPLPADGRLIAPGPEVPEVVARFAGAWIGAALDKGNEALCHTLVVEEVYANGFARVVFSVGTYADWNVRLPDFLRVTGRIVDGELRFRLPEPERVKLAYRVAGETLSGTAEGPDGTTGRASLTRVADVSQVGCASQAGGSPPAAPVTGPRDRLTTAELLTGADPGTGPVHNAYFLPVGQAAPALHPFKGTVTVPTSTMLRARHGCPGLAETFPGFTVAFFTQGEHLVPVVRDILNPPGTLILSPGRDWLNPPETMVVSPGQVWSEPGDGGMARASFPFVVVNQYNNGAHNGLATFLYDDTRISTFRFQVVQETPAGPPFDGWGQAPMTYTPGPIADEAAVRAQFAAELQQHTPIRPWSALPVSTGTQWLEDFDGATAPDDVSASGLIVDGVLYLRGCETRYGPFPFCRHMRHGVFSVTKSLGAAVALLRLAQTYGDQVFDLKIKDYVTVTAADEGWEGVTFAHALNMATGIGDLAPQREPNDVFADENKPKMFEWLRARTAKEKLDVSFSYGQYPWGPGEVLRYNSINTFVLAAAMDSFLKRQTGPQAHLWDMVVAEVFQPIGIFHAPKMHTQEADGGRGIPHLAHGLYPTIDDVAKLTTLLQHGGQHQGQQLLHAGKLAEALYQTNAMGLPVSHQVNRFGVGRYQLSFWSVPYRTANGCFFQIPYMGGAGGHQVVLLPNGISAFRFGDDHHYKVDTMVLVGEAIRPFPCPAGAGEALPPERQALSASDLRAELTGHTFYAYDWHISLAASGVQYGASKGGTEYDVGTWHITAGGHFCNTWLKWLRRRERCFAVYREGETFELHAKDTLDKVVLRRVPGNPEGY